MADGSLKRRRSSFRRQPRLCQSNPSPGSNCVLVAPVTIGDGATIGGGSTIAQDAPANQLTVARARQQTIAAWTRPAKKPKS